MSPRGGDPIIALPKRTNLKTLEDEYAEKLLDTKRGFAQGWEGPVKLIDACRFARFIR